MILTGNAASISRIQVGLVTLISVKRSPIMSRPTKIRPLAFKIGPTARAIAQSASVSGRASPRPPAARLPRVSPDAGILAKQYGTGSPLTTRTRLSPSRIAGIYFCAIAYWLPWAVRVSMITLTFGSPAFNRNIDAPPMPSSGFKITSCSAW